ncbi:MAG TPA: AI-2E family transporter [Gemmataceae bacterium]|nr:AI-2E family transporter [Gemmataceae bacterium]
MSVQEQTHHSGTTRPISTRQREHDVPPSRLGMESFARRTVVAMLIAVLILGLTYLLWRGVHVLLQTFAGVLFAVFLCALADWLSKHTRLSYGWALAVVLIALLLLAGGIAWLLANQLAVQVRDLSQRLPQSGERVRDYLRQYPWGRTLLEQEPDTWDSLARMGQFFDVKGNLAGLTGFLVTGLVILFVGIFGAAEPNMYRSGLLHLVPPAQRRRAEQAIDTLTFNLRWWLVGQVVLMILMWATTTTGLWLIGVPFALTLGLIAGILELVPYIGPWISAVPTALIALTVGPTEVLLVLALYLALHILEGYVLVPLVQRRAVHLPPAVTLVAQVLLGELLGLMGLFVAAPLTLCAVVLLKMLYVEDALGDDAIDVPGEPGNEQKKLG